MCGRYALNQTGRHFAASLQAEWRSAPMLEMRFNIAPTQYAPVLLNDGGRVLDMYRWGLIPFWAKDPAIGNRMINARAETVREKPAFRSAFEKRRCLVPVSGFYEWQKAGKSKVPHWIHPAARGVLTFAGLWERWSPEDAEPVFTYTILTTAANPFMVRLHDRMPVIIAPEDQDRWLDPEAKPDHVAELMVPAPEGVLKAHPVSTLVNAPSNDRPECIEPFGAE